MLDLQAHHTNVKPFSRGANATDTYVNLLCLKQLTDIGLLTRGHYGCCQAQV